MAVAKVKKEETINIKAFNKQFIKLRIVGDSALIVHNWSEKSKREMLDKQMGKSKTKKHPERMPFDDFARSLYWITEIPTKQIVDGNTGELREVVTEELFEQAIKGGAKFGFPANAFKIAGNSAAYNLGWVKNRMALRNSYFVSSEYGELAEIKGDLPLLREDTVNVGGKSRSADLRYRAMFNNWYCDLTLEFNASGDMKLNDVVNVLNAGGYGMGIGEWRPEKDGIFGRYHVEIVK